MNLKFNLEEIDWVDKKYLVKAQALAGFWVDTDRNRLYCARRTELGTAHYYFNEENNEWQLDYFCDYWQNDFKENTGIVISLEDYRLGMIKGKLHLFNKGNKDSEDNISKGYICLDATKQYLALYNMPDIDFKHFNSYIMHYKPKVAYYGNFKYIVFDTDFINKYVLFYNFLK